MFPRRNFGRSTCRCRNFVRKPLISISINSFAVTILVYINTHVTCKMSTRWAWRYNGNGARRLWLLFMVTEVRQGFLNMRALAGNPSFRHWSPLLWCLMTGFANGYFVWILSLSFPFLCFRPTWWVMRPLSLLFFKFPWRLTFIFSYVWYQLCWEYQGIWLRKVPGEVSILLRC